MDLADPLWTEKWSKVSSRPDFPDFAAAVGRWANGRELAFGTDAEPGSSLWLATLSEAMGGHFHEGMAVLDYGCGAGRYAEFLRQRLQRFGYYGLEKPGSRDRHGENSIAVARR